MCISTHRNNTNITSHRNEQRKHQRPTVRKVVANTYYTHTFSRTQHTHIPSQYILDQNKKKAAIYEIKETRNEHHAYITL